MKRFFKSSEDFTRQIVMVELLEIDGVVYKREWRRMTIAGKLRKVKSAWFQIPDKIVNLSTGNRNGHPYRLRFDKRELYSAPLHSNLGPRL